MTREEKQMNRRLVRRRYAELKTKAARGVFLDQHCARAIERRLRTMRPRADDAWRWRSPAEDGAEEIASAAWADEAGFALDDVAAAAGFIRDMWDEFVGLDPDDSPKKGFVTKAGEALRPAPGSSPLPKTKKEAPPGLASRRRGLSRGFPRGPLQTPVAKPNEGRSQVAGLSRGFPRGPLQTLPQTTPKVKQK